MNEFTKEELAHISDAILYGTESLSSRKDILIHIREKVLKMIDNYCEHKKIVWPLYTVTGEMPCAVMCYECYPSVDRELISDEDNE